MVTRYLGSALYKGLSSDTKPTTAAATAIFIETDTRLTYVYDGAGNWNESAAAAGRAGSSSVANGETISHGLSGTPNVVTLTPSVPSRVTAVTARSASTFTVSLQDITGSPIGTAEIIYWRASI